MAFAAMESVRSAELDAENRIQEAVSLSQQSVEQAKLTSDTIVSEANRDADTIIAHSTQKASAKAEEIMVTARNNALLEADKLKRECESKQDAANKAILKLIQ